MSKMSVKKQRVRRGGGGGGEREKEKNCITKTSVKEYQAGVVGGSRLRQRRETD